MLGHAGQLVNVAVQAALDNLLDLDMRIDPGDLVERGIGRAGVGSGYV